MSDFTHLDYKIHPHFICVSSQFGENGYFYAKGSFYFFSYDNEEDEYFVELISESKQGFKVECLEREVTVPVLFWSKIKRMQ